MKTFLKYFVVLGALAGAGYTAYYYAMKYARDHRPSPWRLAAVTRGMLTCSAS